MVHCAKQWVENITTKQGKAHTLQSLGWEKGPLLTMVPHMVTEQPLCGKPLGAVRTLKPLLCSMKAREKGEGAVRKEIKAETTAQKEGKRSSYSRAENSSLQADTADTDYKAKRSKQKKTPLAKTNLPPLRAASLGCQCRNWGAIITHTSPAQHKGTQQANRSAAASAQLLPLTSVLGPCKRKALAAAV